MQSRRAPRCLLSALAVLAPPCCSTAPDEPEPPPAATRWLKGNLHTHSLWSDGNDFPEVIARWYKERGYDFLALSDHNILADHEKWLPVDEVVRRGGRTALQRYRELFGRDWVETRERGSRLEVRLKRLDEFAPLLEEPGRFLLVQAEEITDRCAERPVHMNATNLAEPVPPQGGRSVQEVMRNNLRAVAEQSRRLDRPMIAHLNHPNFGWGVTAEDLAAVVEEQFFEIWNGHPEVNHRGDAAHASVERMWDIANTLRIASGAPPLFGLAVDDSHNYWNEAGSIPGRGWIMVRSPARTAAAIVAAIAAGDFYASSGVVLDEVRLWDGVLSLRIRAESGVAYRTEFIGTRAGFDPTAIPVEVGGIARADITRRYPDEIGAVLAAADGPNPSYRLRGDELYVRAVVTADRPPQRPVWAGQREQAWTQPVGWR